MKKTAIAILALFTATVLGAQDFDGLNMSMGNLYRISDAQTRSISPENYTGEPGGGAKASGEEPYIRNVNNGAWWAREVGTGWKCSPFFKIASGETMTIAEMDGPGAIQHIWMAGIAEWRWTILRMYWDDETTPSVECSVADFFCQGWNQYAHVNSAAICVNPAIAFNSYWQMPFRKKCKITLENLSTKEMNIFYQVNYTLTKIPKDAAYFHAQFRRERFCETSDFVILDGVKGRGQFVGVYMAWGVHNTGWWGEGEVKFYIDDDTKYPSICTTGLEDYFCGSYDWEIDGQYITYTTPYTGLCQVIRPDGTYESQQRFGLYRWHIMDPVRFRKGLKVTVQDLGWRSGGRFCKQHSDISTTAFWYQTEPHAEFPQFPDKNELENL